MSSFEVEGLKELEKQLLELGAIGAKKALRASMMKSTKPILDRMKQTVPDKSGQLKKTIKRKFTAGKYAAGQLDVGPMGKKSFYARFVEYGTAPHKIGKGANRVGHRGKIQNKGGGAMHPGSKAKPFIRPAWEAGQGALVDVFKAELNKSIAKVASKAKK